MEQSVRSWFGYRLAIALTVLSGVESHARAQQSERVEWQPEWREVKPAESARRSA